MSDAMGELFPDCAPGCGLEAPADAVLPSAGRDLGGDLACVRIRGLRYDDLEFSAGMAEREGWDSAMSWFAVHVAHDPGGCFIAEVNGNPVGMITSTRFPRSGWLGNLIVLPECRRNGIARRLMVHAMNLLERRGVRTMRLEADPMGVGIYKRLGFAGQFRTVSYRKQPPHQMRRHRAARMTYADLDAVKTFDRDCFGDDRGRLLGMYLNLASCAYIVREGADPTGYVFGLPTRRGTRIGPLVAVGASAAGDLIDAVLGDSSTTGGAAIGVPNRNTAAAELVRSRGFQESSSTLRMVRGEAAADSDAEKIFGIINGALG